MRTLPLLAAAALALTAGACAAPPAEKSTADGAASRSAEKGRTGQPWWKLSQYRREADFKPWVYGDVRPGKGLLGNEGDGFVLYRKGEVGSSASTKPSKVRR